VGEPYIANRCAVPARNRRLDLTSGPHLFTLRDRHSSPARRALPPIWTGNDAEWSRSGTAQIGMFGASRLGPGRGLVSPGEPPRGPACPGVGNEFPDDVVGQVRVGQADEDQPRAMPVFRAGMRPFGYGFCDGLLAEGDVDPLIIKATGETRPAMNTEGRPPAVIVFLGPGES
jgi:hypothetical protein